MLKTNTNQKGFTIVELLIVIVVIGILAMLVLNTFNGIQQSARDTERQTDATSVAKQLEAYIAQSQGGGYPQFAQFGTPPTPNSASLLLKGTSENAYSAPNRSDFDWNNAQATDATDGAYGYQAYNEERSTPLASRTACTTDDACKSFRITYWSEKENTFKVIDSLN